MAVKAVVTEEYDRRKKTNEKKEKEKVGRFINLVKKVSNIAQEFPRL